MNWLFKRPAMAYINTKMKSMVILEWTLSESSGYLKLDPDWNRRTKTSINLLKFRIIYFTQLNNYEDYAVG